MMMCMTEKQKVDWIINFVDRMSQKNGGIFITKEGKKLDWGQAFCYIAYGPEWNEHLKKENIYTPSSEDIEIVKNWEKNN